MAEFFESQATLSPSFTHLTSSESNGPSTLPLEWYIAGYTTLNLNLFKGTLGLLIFLYTHTHIHPCTHTHTHTHSRTGNAVQKGQSNDLWKENHSLTIFTRSNFCLKCEIWIFRRLKKSSDQYWKTSCKKHARVDSGSGQVVGFSESHKDIKHAATRRPQWFATWHLQQ